MLCFVLPTTLSSRAPLAAKASPGTLSERADPDATPFHSAYDHLGSTSLITGAHGQRLARLQYGPWGEELGGGHNRSRFTYTGHQREKRTGYYYSVWRYLDPRAGRWTQRDPLSTVEGTNTYSYARNRPTRYTDPHGLTVNFKNPPPGIILALTSSRSAHSLWQLLDQKKDWLFEVEFRDLANVVYYAGHKEEVTVDSAVRAVEAGDALFRMGHTDPPESTGSKCPNPEKKVNITVWTGSHIVLRRISNERYMKILTGEDPYKRLSMKLQRTAALQPGEDLPIIAIMGTVVHEFTHGHQWMTGLPQYEPSAYWAGWNAMKEAIR